MKTVVPTHFLRVSHKFFAWHVGLDKDLKSGPTLLYLYLFFICHDRDYCWPSQNTLARLCKVSERTLQGYISELVRREYIAVERQGTRNIYRLLRSPRVCHLLELARMEMLAEMEELKGEDFSPLQPEQTKISTGKGEKFSCSLIKEIKEEIKELNTPLPPTASSGPRPGRRVCSSLSSGSGDSSASAPRRKLQDEFPKLWERWPRKQDRFGAYREYVRLAKSGDLPPLDELVGVIKRLADKDRSWKKGYVPNLRFWLRDRRWQDLPFGEQEPASMEAGSVPVNPEEIQAQERALAEAVQRRVIKQPSCPGPETRLREETEARLCVMWPKVPRGMIAAGLCLARDRMSAVAAKLSNGQTVMPPPASDPGVIARHLREVVAAPA